MRAISVRVLCAVTLITAGLAVPFMGTASAKDIAKPISANAPALKVTFTTVGQNGALTFSGVKNQVVAVTTSAGTYAANCDVMVSVLKKTTTVVAPVCGGIAGTTGNFTLTSDATYTIKIDTQSHTPATLKVAVTATAAIASITPNAAAVTFAVPPTSTTDFGFIGKAGQRLSATTTGGTFSNGCQVTLSIIAPNGTTVLGTTTCAGVAGYVAALDSVGAGTYKLRVTNNASPTGSVKLSVFQFTDKTSAIVANGAAATGKVGFPGQRYSLTFAGTVGEKISASVTSGDLNGYVELHKPDGSYAGIYSSGTTTAYFGPFTLTVAGTWSLLVYGSGPNVGSSTVKLYTFTDVAGGTIVANGPTKSLTLATPGQQGSFTFAGTVGQKISYQVTNGNLNGYVELHKPDGTYAGSYTSGTTGNFADAFTLTVSGTWSLLVYGNGPNIGSVTVQLYTFTDNAAGTITAGGATKAVAITTPGQNGTLTFSGTNGDSRTFQVTASTLSGYVNLYKPDGTYAGSYACLSATCTSGPVTLNATGTWTLLVDPGSTSTGSVTIKLT